MARLQLGKSLLHQLGVAEEATYTRGSIIGSVLADLPWNSRVRGVRFLKTKKIECILTTNVYKLGKTGDIVEVAPGYLRNYLLPNSMALPNLPHYALVAKNKLKMDKASEGGEKDDLQLDGTDESQNKESIREYQTAVRRLDRALLGLRRLVLNYGKELRFPVTKKELIAEVERQLRVIIQPENVVMPDDITHCGTYEIPLRFPSSVPLPAGKKEHILKVKVQRR